MRRAGIIDSDSGVLSLSDLTRRWLETGDARIPVAIVHSRIRFVGEMLAELREPKSTQELLIAARRYGLTWNTPTPIHQRRGWLQSAGLVEPADDRLVITAAGTSLLSQLTLHDPEGPASLDPVPDHPATVVDQASPAEADQLANEIEDAATDSTNSARFEKAITQAFIYLGFVARQLGGPGKTDVLVTAPLGKDQSYRVTVDAKTTSRGSLKEPHVDWLTLQEHRVKHQAKYSLLVAPNPSGQRLVERARESEISVLSSEQLAALCRQHAHAPLSLVDYEHIFRAHGGADLAKIDDRTEDLQRLRKLAAALCTELAEKTPRFGRMSARDLLVLLAESAAEGSSQEEIQDILDTLAHPIVRSCRRQRPRWLLARHRTRGLPAPTAAAGGRDGRGPASR